MTKKIGELNLIDGTADIECENGWHGVNAGKRFKVARVTKCDCFKLLPFRLSHFEKHIPALKWAQDRLRARRRAQTTRHRRVGSLGGTGIDSNYPTSPTK